MGKGGQLKKGEILAAETIATGGVTKTSTIHADSTDTDAAAANKSTAYTWRATAASTNGPWYSRGGMHVNEAGMGVNVMCTPIFLAVTAGATFAKAPESFGFLAEAWPYGYSPTPVHVFAVLFIVQVLMAKFVHGMKHTFTSVAVPCYLTSLLVLPATLQSPVFGTIALSVAIAMWRVGVCMSICLYRYAAHAAFKCGPITQLFLNVLGCLAHQGGPVWWASQHRCHHKYCDMPRDPHSPIQVGVEKAFRFFGDHNDVDEEFAPKHNDTWYLRILDTWAFAVASLEMFAAYHLFGREGLFVSYTSLWICQTITLWFNIANHPPDAPGEVCKAANHKMDPTGWYPAFLLLDVLYPYFGVVVSEGNHQDHHDHSMLAKRDSTDCAYYSFIWPMEKLGLVWNVQVKPEKES